MTSQPEPQCHIIITRDEIAVTVSRLAGEIRRDYLGKYPLLIGVLKGSFMFLADLVRQLNFPLEIDFIGVSSYGAGTDSCGKATIVGELRSQVKGREVVVVEDIVDSGLTTSFLLDELRRREPASLRLCALADKVSRRQSPVTIDYRGFAVPDKFIVGYGLDLGEKFRYLPDICYVEGKE